MEIPLWCLIASLLLVSVKGGAQHHHIYYDRPESSSPAPSPFPSISNRQAETKEVILYLTPDQIQALQSAGVAVKHLTPLEKSSQWQQQSVKENTEVQYGSLNSKEVNNPQPETLNNLQINEELAKQSQSEEQTTQNSLPKNKYTTEPWQQGYSPLFVQKKINREKSSSTEYVHYVPNFKNEELKKNQYHNRPLSSYRFGNTQTNLDPRDIQTEVPQVQNSEEIQQIHTFTIRPEQAQHQTESLIQFQTIKENSGPVTFDEKIREPTKVWRFRVQEPPKGWQPPQIWEPAKVHEPEEIQTHEAPFVQTQKVAENLAQQKAELVHREQEIRVKLQQIKESGNHDELKYGIELDKLTKNLVNQNALAQKLVLESIAKKSQSGVIKENNRNKWRHSAETSKQDKVSEPTPVLLSIPASLKTSSPQPYHTPLNHHYQATGLARSQPAPNPASDDVEKSVSVSSNVYVKVDNPYIIQKVVPITVNHDIPLRYHPSHSSKLVIRPIWEH